MAHPEDRDRRHRRQRLEQHRDLAAAALHAVLGPGVLVRAGTSSSRARSRRSAISSRARATAVSSRLPPPMLPQVSAAPTTIFAPASRGACPRTATTVTSTPGGASRRSCCTRPNQSMRQASASSACGSRPPPAVASPPRPCSAAPGRLERPEHGLGRGRGPEVDRRARPARTPPTASRSASRTLNASISGGSPTALDPYTTPSSVARSSSVHAEVLGHLREARQLVGARRLGGQPAAVRRRRSSSQRRSSRVSQPAPCTKPPSIWPRSTSGERLSPTSCTMSTRRSAVGAGEAVDLDLGRRGAVGEVLERLALHPRRRPSAGPRCGRSRPPTAAPAGSRRRAPARPRRSAGRGTRGR